MLEQVFADSIVRDHNVVQTRASCELERGRFVVVALVERDEARYKALDLGPVEVGCWVRVAEVEEGKTLLRHVALLSGS